MNPTPTPLSAQVQEWRDKLRAAIINLPEGKSFNPAQMTPSETRYYRFGHRDARHAAAELALSAVPFNQVVPEGWKLVPIEPTEPMMQAGMTAWKHAQGTLASYFADRCAYRALLAASPQPVSQPGEALPAELPKSNKANLESASGGNDLQTALPEGTLDAENQWLGDMMILQVLADSEHVNEQEREVLTRWMESAPLPPGESAGSAGSNKTASSPRPVPSLTEQQTSFHQGTRETGAFAAPVEALEVLRTKFEAWAQREQIDICRTTLPQFKGRYDSPRTEWAWAGWQAHALVVQPPQAVQEDERPLFKCGSECDHLCQQPDGFGGCGKRAPRLVASQPPQAVQEVRRLSVEEMLSVSASIDQSGAITPWVDAMLHKFCEVNGLKLAAISATKENP